MAYVVDTGGGRNTGKKPTVNAVYQGLPGQYNPITPRPNYSTPSSALATGGYTSTGTSGGSSGGSSGGAAGAVTVQQQSYDPMAAYMAMIAAREEAQRKAREEAYQKAAAQQKSNYDYALGQVNNATNDALREAYINRMLTERNLQQQLTAQGLNGGASETTTASLYNNYGNARNELEKERQNQIGSISNTYQNNMAQLEAQRASGEAASLADYAPQLANLVANNAPNAVTMMQAETTGDTNLGYLEYLRRMAELMGQAG